MLLDLRPTRRRVTASIGVVTVLAACEQEADILALADMTMYAAKDDGRSSYVVLDESDTRQPRSGARLEWRGRIEEALEQGTFVLLVQPILDLHTDRVRSAEVLMRLRDGDELVNPAKFLYIAERCGLMPAIDAHVVRVSVALLAQLRAIEPDSHLEIDLSGHSTGDPDIERVIVQALGEHQVGSTALILGVTETAAAADFALARELAERMSMLGCRSPSTTSAPGSGRSTTSSTCTSTTSRSAASSSGVPAPRAWPARSCARSSHRPRPRQADGGRVRC